MMVLGEVVFSTQRGFNYVIHFDGGFLLTFSCSFAQTGFSVMVRLYIYYPSYASRAS
jgi:hypothetical protein